MAKDYKAEYAAKLRDPRWQKMRLEIMNRDQFMCQICLETTKTLNVHHTKYVSGKKPWEYDPVSLVTLCEDCHKEEPANYNEALAELFEVIKGKRYTSNQVNMLQQVFFIINERDVHGDVIFMMDLANTPTAIKAAKDAIDAKYVEEWEKHFGKLEGKKNG